MRDTPRRFSVTATESRTWRGSRAAPPGVPPERAKALQEAFMAMQSDADYLKEAERLGLDVSPVDGAQALALIERLAASPKELLDYMKKLHGDK